MTPSIGITLGLEKTDPTRAVKLAALAEAQGFDGTLATDHFQPWLPRHGQSSFVWSVLGAIAERTRGNFGPGMAVAGYRYHPATIAQAAATMETMYPGRHWLGIGAGEALNEHVTASYWPDATERVDRMFEAIELIKRLFRASISGRDVKFSGEYFQLETSRLWTMPEAPPPILVSTGGLLTARRAGRHADGMITMGNSYDHTAQVIERFRKGARDAGRDPAHLLTVLNLYLSWAPTDEEAVEHALREWPIGAMRFPKGDVRSPMMFEQMAKLVKPEDLQPSLQMSADLDVHRAHIQRFIDLGFDRVYLHNVSADQESWLHHFGTSVIPKLTR